jgi:MFS family permease
MPTGTGVKKGFLTAWVLVIALGALTFGLAIGQWSMYVQTFKCSYLLNGKGEVDDSFLVGFSGAIATVGGTIGALFGGRFLDNGKKVCIHAANIITIVGALIMAASGPYFSGKSFNDTRSQQTYVWMLLAGRVIQGLGGGCYTVYINSMLNDIAPIEYKGQIGVSFQFFVTVGILVANLFGLPFLINDGAKCDLIPYYINSKDNWEFIRAQYFRLFFSAPAIFALL